MNVADQSAWTHKGSSPAVSGELTCATGTCGICCLRSSCSLWSPPKYRSGLPLLEVVKPNDCSCPFLTVRSSLLLSGVLLTEALDWAGHESTPGTYWEATFSSSKKTHEPKLCPQEQWTLQLMRNREEQHFYLSFFLMLGWGRQNTATTFTDKWEHAVLDPRESAWNNTQKKWSSKSKIFINTHC